MIRRIFISSVQREFSIERKSTGLRPPVFDVDARHFTVTVYRPEFDEQGLRVPENSEELGPKTTELGPKTTELGPKPDFEMIMKGHRKDFRMTCANVWSCLVGDRTLSRRAIAVKLKIAESSVQSAMNALQEVDLLAKEGYGKGRVWIVKYSAMGRVTEDRGEVKPQKRAP